MFDHNDIFSDELIGIYSIGLSTLYRNTNHEFYKKWITLFDPKGNLNDKCAYLLISCFIVGPNERPPVHAADEDFDPDEEDPDSEEDEEMVMRRLETIKKAQNAVPVNIPSIIDKMY